MAISTADMESMLNTEPSVEEALSETTELSNQLEERTKLNVNLGLSDEALNEAIEYMSGAIDVPKYMEGFSNEKLRNVTTVATVSQVARVPGLIKLLNDTNALLFASNDLQNMNMNELTKLSRSLSEEIRLILDGARRTLETLDKLDAPVSANQQLLDKLLQMPDDEIRAMKEYIEGKKDRAQ